MANINVTINGAQLSVNEGVTILEAARESGIDIPTLCYIAELAPTGACRVCVVEVEGPRTLIAACHMPVTQGMVIQTHSPRVLEARRAIVELLLASHCGSCYMCEKANICELRQIAADLDVGLPRFPTSRRYYPMEDVSPYIVRDLTKCILCRRCVMACNEIAKKHVYGIAYRGFASKIIVNFDEAINTEACKDCGICIPYCPTGALRTPEDIHQEKKGTPLVIKG
ncbi:MAG: 2Fe-2S iron-sulfur cluster-binding protein [Dehalococcoidales bacterium]|nr:2Fe-2S iron-sulfur cluster-binding protein [Dehalococcoidales bacterium]